MVERPKLVKLLMIFYGSRAVVLALISFLPWVLLEEGSGQPRYRPFGGFILILFLYYGSLVGALLNLSVAYGLSRVEGWARTLGITISVLGALLLVQGALSLSVNCARAVRCWKMTISIIR